MTSSTDDIIPYVRTANLSVLGGTAGQVLRVTDAASGLLEWADVGDVTAIEGPYADIATAEADLPAGKLYCITTDEIVRITLL